MSVSRRRSSRVIAQKAESEEYQDTEASAVPEGEEPVVEEQLVVEEPPVSALPSRGSRSSRRTVASPSGRSSRRNAASSSGSLREGAARSSRRLLTPEQRAAKRAAIMTTIKLLLLVAVIGGGGFAGWWFAVRVTPEVKMAKSQLTEVERLMDTIETQVQKRQPAEARIAYEQALRVLTDSNELGHAEATVSPDAPGLANIKYAQIAREHLLKLQDEALKEIERAERDARADANLRSLLDRFAKLHDQDFDDAMLTNLEKDCNKFMDNPVDPEAASDKERVAEYPLLISEIKTRMAKIVEEKDQRLASITAVPEREARGVAAILVKQEQFKDAMAKIDEIQRQYPEAKLDPVREYVTKAAEEAWASAKTYADTHYQTATASGTTRDLREPARKKAQTRMQQVIDRFGIEIYIDQAKRALESFK